MKCPVCDVTLSISSREGVEIDFCPQCRGVWLDRGELDKIIDRVATSQAPSPREQREQRPPEPSRYDQPRYDDRSHRHDDRPRYDDDYWKKQKKKKKAKSFIEDIFDF
jgi:Zn-finger nucleic acid-binding protein